MSHILVLFLFTFVILSTDHRTINQPTELTNGTRSGDQQHIHVCMCAVDGKIPLYTPHLHIWIFFKRIQFSKAVLTTEFHRKAKIDSIRLFCCSVIIYPHINGIVPIERDTATNLTVQFLIYWYMLEHTGKRYIYFTTLFSYGRHHE